MPRTQLR